MPTPDRAPRTAADYWSLPDGERAELIDGSLYAMTPPNRRHQDVVFGMAGPSPTMWTPAGALAGSTWRPLP